MSCGYLFSTSSEEEVNTCLSSLVFKDKSVLFQTHSIIPGKTIIFLLDRFANKLHGPFNALNVSYDKGLTVQCERGFAGTGSIETFHSCEQDGEISELMVEDLLGELGVGTDTMADLSASRTNSSSSLDFSAVTAALDGRNNCLDVSLNEKETMLEGIEIQHSEDALIVARRLGEQHGWSELYIEEIAHLLKMQQLRRKETVALGKALRAGNRVEKNAKSRGIRAKRKSTRPRNERSHISYNDQCEAPQTGTLKKQHSSLEKKNYKSATRIKRRFCVHDKPEIVVDGQNIAVHWCDEHTHGNKFSDIEGIFAVILFWRKRGHIVRVLLPRFWAKKVREVAPRAQADALDLLLRDGTVCFTPSQEGHGGDDLYVIQYAMHRDGLIISNDMFRDHISEQAGLADFLRESLVPFSFVGGMYIPSPEMLTKLGLPLSSRNECSDFTLQQK